MIRSLIASGTLLLLSAAPAHAAFHLWHVKEVFSNADGSVQFIELYNSFSGEQFVANHTLRANSDGVINDFVIPSNLPNTPSTADTHMLIATPGFGDLPGGVTPDFTLPDPGVSGPFFDPNASSITITFVGSNDSLTFSSSLLPNDGFHSLTDTNAMGSAGPFGSPPNITVTTNTPTRFPNIAGQIDLRPATLPGDFNDDGTVDAADYTVWRDGLGTDFELQHYDQWKQNFAAAQPAAAATLAAAVPEPATWLLLSLAAAALWLTKPRRS